MIKEEVNKKGSRSKKITYIIIGVLVSLLVLGIIGALTANQLGS